METLKLATETREETGRQAKKVRAAGRIPAVIYGRGTDNRNVSVEYNPFEKAYRAGGESTLIDLNIGDETVKALIKDVKRDPVSDAYIHIDFYEVNLKEKVTVEVSLNFTGKEEAAAVRELGGSFLTTNDTIEIECLPTNLVHEIDVDVSSLKTFDDVIRASDIPLPEGVELITDPELTIAYVEEPRSEEEIEAEEAAIAAEADVSEIKTEAEEKKEQEEAEKAAEGEEQKAE